MHTCIRLQSGGCTAPASQETGAKAPDYKERDGRRQPVLVYPGSHLLEVRVLLPESPCSRPLGISLAFQEDLPDCRSTPMRRYPKPFLNCFRSNASNQ